MANRDLILHNFWWKITAFLLAIIVWFVVNGGDLPAAPTAQLAPQPTKTFTDHPLLLIREATDQRPISIEPTQIEVQVTAAPAEMAALRQIDIQAFVDVAEVRPDGKARIRVYLPRGVRLDRLDPAVATVRIGPPPNLEPRAP